MRRLLGLLMFLSLCFSQVLIGQTYEDGVSSYKAANTAFLMNNKQDEQEELEEALKIFDALAKNDNKSLIMCYLLSIKLGKPFLLEELLFQYIKKEHKDFSTVEAMKFCGDDKTLILDKLKEIAGQNEKQAIKLLEEAKNCAKLEDYQAALDKLQQVEKLWELDEVKTLKPVYIQKENEKKIKRIIEKVKNLCSRGLYKDALDTLNKEKGFLPAHEFKKLETEIKKKWAEEILGEARKKFKSKQYPETITLCDEAYNKYPLKEALELKNDAINKKNKAWKKQQRKNQKKPKRGFSLFGDFGSIGKTNLTSTSFSWTGNSNQFATVTDSNNVRTEPVDKKEKNFGYSFGLIGMFSPSVGIMASIGFMTQQWTVLTDYRFSWTWWDHSSASATGSMNDNAKISMKPVSLDLLVAMDLKGGTIFKFYAGPTLFLTNIDFRARLGYGGVWIKGEYIYPEWFPFEYVIQAKEYLFGGNAGIDLEYKYTTFSSLYLGFQYFWLPEKNYSLRVIAQSYPGQIWGSLFSVGNPYDLAHLPDYGIKLKLSFYKIILGIRLYL
jgi:hypothetical protein